jgi:hypothetical protein
MAQIPLGQYIARDEARGGIGATPGGAPRVDLSPVVNQLGRMAANVQRERAELEHAQESERRRLAHNEAVGYATNIDSQADIEWTERLQKAADDPKGMTERVLKEYDAYKTEVVSKAPDGARQIIENNLTRKRTLLHGKAFQIETEARQAAVLQADDEGTDIDSRAVYANPALFQEKLAGRLAANKTLDIPEPVRAARLQKARETLVWAAATGFAEQYPNETLAALGQGGPHYDEATREKVLAHLKGGGSGVGVVPGMIRPGVFDSKESQQAFEDAKRPRSAAHPALGMLPFTRVDDIARVARTAIERGVSEIRVSLVDRARDVQAAVASGVPVSSADVAGMQEQYAVAYGPIDGARRYHDEVGVPLLVGQGIGQLRTASPADRAAILASSKPTGVDGAADKKVIHDALLQANAIVEKKLTEDPANYAASTPHVAAALQALQGANGPGRAAAVEAYATATLAEQERLGAPSPRLLTSSQSDAVVKLFTDSRPEGAADVVAGLEQEWGKRWPLVYKQLAQENKLTPAALVIPNMKDAGSKARMASVSAMKPDDLKGLLASGDAKDVRDKLQGYFEPAARTLMAQSTGGLSAATSIMEQAEKLAFVYKSQGKSAGDAAKQAYDEVIGWKYEFTPTYRVPRDQQPNLVTRGASYALSDLGRIALFDSPYPMGANNRERQSLDAIKANGYWVTNEDETGLVLKVRGKDNSEYTAYRADGKAVEYKWLELQRLAGDSQDVERRMIEAGKATELESARKRQQAEEEARQQRLRDLGLR